MIEQRLGLGRGRGQRVEWKKLSVGSAMTGLDVSPHLKV